MQDDTIRNKLQLCVDAFNKWASKGSLKLPPDRLYTERRGVFYTTMRREGLTCDMQRTSRREQNSITVEDLKLDINDAGFLIGIEFKRPDNYSRNFDLLSLLQSQTPYLIYTVHSEPLGYFVDDLLNKIQNF